MSASRIAPALLCVLLGACSASPQHSEHPPVVIEQSPRIAQPPRAEYALGVLPPPLRRVRWPAPPRVRREVELRGAAITQSNVRVRVRGDVPRLEVRADDVDLVLDPVVARGQRRLRVTGGRFGFIELPVPAQHHPPPAVWRRDWLVEDVTFDGVEVEASDSGFFLRGRRIALLRSRVRAERYSVWCGDTQDFHSEDLVLAGNRFESAGPEATVRLVNVRRAVVVDNVLVNSIKHDFRVHGDSDRVVFARNRLLNTGIMIGSMDGDRIGTVWILDNTLHHNVPSLFEAEPQRVRQLVVRGNQVFSDVWRCFVCNRAPEGWDIAEHVVAPYRAPEP
jgi:hypothetical protein